ncbi:MAG: AAA family ATPase, partial [Candidatus Helarchaeales archaeon]
MVHVKSLRLRGFKSLGVRKLEQIDFDRGFSVIVGANGSGKSNILEAFSFVMGQMSSKSLRAGNMKHLIYSGNKEKGIPPADEAYVELILSNEDRGIPIDSDVVRISRSINRNGKGKYKLNGVATTRTEIVDLLSMGGLHSNSYNIVLQGNVYEIVNMTKVERRRLIEEIAGISAYDEKKGQAQVELEKVEANLSQIRILLNEVSRQLESLRAERDDALKYKRLTTRLRNLELAMKLIDINSLEARIKSLSTKEARLSGQLNELDRSIEDKRGQASEINACLKKLKETLVEKQDGELIALNRRLTALRDRLTDLESELKYLKADKEKQESTRMQVMDLNKKLEREARLLESEISGLEDAIAAKEGIRVQKESELEQLRSELANTDNKYQQLLSDKENLRHELDEARSERNKHLSELKITEKYVNDDRRALDRLTAKFSGHGGELGRIEGRIQALQSELKSLDVANNKRTPKDIQEMIRDLEFKSKRVKDEIREKSEKIYEIRSLIKATRNLKPAAVNRAIDALMKARDDGIIDGIYNSISRLGKIDPKYAIAMDVAAGSRANYVVVQNCRVATECIRFLKENKLGRLTFVPLEDIKYSDNNRRFEHRAGVHGRAVDLIDFDLKFLPAFEFIFGRTYIVDNLEIARSFAPGFRKVTIDGDVVEPSNLMTGGSINRNRTGKIFLEDGKEKLPVLEAELNQLRSEERDIERRIRDLRAEISDYYTFKIENEKKRSQIREQIAKLEARRDEFMGNRAEISRSIEEIRSRIAENEVKKEELAGKVSACNEYIADLEGKIKTIDMELKRSPHGSLKAAISGLEREIKAIEGEINKLNLELT